MCPCLFPICFKVEEIVSWVNRVPTSSAWMPQVVYNLELCTCLRSITQYLMGFSGCLKKGEAMTKVGYARVSSLGQDLTVQLEKLSECDKIFREKRSGVDAGRPALKACLEYLREGDTPRQRSLTAWPVRPQIFTARVRADAEGRRIQGAR